MIQLFFFLLPGLLQGKTLQLRNKVFKLDLVGKGCTFQGPDSLSPGSFALYNNCSGNEFAWIKHPDHSYYLYNHKGRKYFHRDDELEEVEQINKTCALVDHPPEINQTGYQVRRDLLEKKYISVKIITDNLRLQVLQGDKKLLQSSTVNIITVAKQIYTGFKPSEYQLNLEVDSVEHRQGPPLPWETGGPYSAEIVFLLFATWAQQQRYYERFHTVILLTGIPLTGSVIGIASLGSFCKGGIAIVESLYTDMAVAKTLAHELGHTLGIRHINSYVSGTSLDSASKVLECSKQTTSVMSPYIVGTSAPWDSCSLEWFNMYMKGYPYNCHLRPGTCTYSGGGLVQGCMDSSTPLCGNTVVDPGEECDCGDNIAECDDPCCNPLTCKLKGACSPLDHACCDPKTCQPIRTKNHQCREALGGPCETAAYCDGENLQCPEENSKDFTTCTEDNQQGTCYLGKCVSHSISCNYVKKNLNTVDIVGPCIRAVTGDVACKDLYCEYGTSGFCTYFQAPQRLKVPEGVRCNPGSYCLEQKCTRLEDEDTPEPTAEQTLEPTTEPTPEPTTEPTLQPTLEPTSTDETPKPKTYRKRCVWRHRKRFCRKRTNQPRSSKESPKPVTSHPLATVEDPQAT